MSLAEAQALTAGLPEVFGILHRHLPGDEALLALAQAQLEAAGMGAEVYSSTVDEALSDWRYVPRGLPKHILHLPRNWDVFSTSDRARLLEFARALGGKVRGLVFHDQPDWGTRRESLMTVLAELNGQLDATEGQPTLFLEYAAGPEPAAYGDIIERLASLPRISACIDTGHMTIFVANRWMNERYPHLNLRAIDPRDPALAGVSADLQQAGQRASDGLVGLVDRVARLGKPLHFHLHDGHLLSRTSRYGVADHLPFGTALPVGTALHPDGRLPTFLGNEGLGRVLAAVRAQLSSAHVSLTLEIHPHLLLTRKPLGEWAGIFSRWTDLTNAELAHAWLDQVTAQAALLRRLWASAL